jgi:hypothetical protein
MRILNIVIDMSNVSAGTCAVIKFQRLIVYNLEGFVECRKPNTKSQNERSKVDGIIYRVADVSNVSGCILDYVKVLIIESGGLYVYVVQSNICVVLVKMSKIRNNGTYLHYARDQDSHLWDVSGCPVNATICFVEVWKIEINVADLSNERGLDIYLSDASGWNVSVIILKL